MDALVFWILIGAALLFVIVRAILRAVTPPRPLRVTGHLPGEGDFEFAIVGERAYQSALKRICGPPTFKGYEHEATAVLILEDDNPHDNKAVRVMIDGYTVGYMPRKMAREYRAKIGEAGHPYGLFTCAALIRGGWDRGGSDRGPYGVVLDLPVKPTRRKNRI